MVYDKVHDAVLNSCVGRCSGLPCNALSAREFDIFAVHILNFVAVSVH